MKLSPSEGDPEALTEQYGRIRDVEVVEDRLYFITNNTDGRGSPDSEDDQLVRYSP